MKKTAIVLAASIVSAVCPQSAAWSKSSLLLQTVPMLASLKKSPDQTQIIIGDDGLLQAFKGKTLRTDIKIFDGYKLTDRQGYIYNITNGPADMTVSNEGVIEYAIQENSETKLIPFSILIKNQITGKTYSKNVQIAVLETEVFASGTFGKTGGQAADEFEDVVLTVPPDTFTEQAFVEVLRAVDKEGYYAYTIRSSAPMLKAAQLRLPDPILRKAPEGSNAVLQSRKMFQQVKAVEQTEVAETGWISWDKWKADYVEITTGIINSKNRLPGGVKEKPTHEGVKNTIENSSEMFSLCKKESYETDCGGKTPVVFIHGYSMGGNLGGGEGTWGKLPELIKAEGYAVFEFKWRTNARFADAAADFADAIRLIQEKSKKKIHIVAHSFGGLVSRAYLQNYAAGRQYTDNIQSLVTLGTPHSGIFDKDGTYHGLEFKKGQDSDTFEGCMQISCHEAGEPTPEAYTIDPWTEKNIEINDYFGIDKNQGKFIANIQDTSGEHDLPVDVLALIGLPAESLENNYKTGDDLITYTGQRFSRTWGNEIIKTDAQEGFGGGKVREKILGVSDYDKNAIPKGNLSNELIEIWKKDNFKGYFHSSFVMDTGGAAEARVRIDDSLNFRKTDAPHAALSEIKAWLRPSDYSEPLSINLHLQVVNADTQQPVASAAVYFNINGMLACSTENYGVTDANGNLTKRIEFHGVSKYTALITADGYRSEEFDTGYTTGLTPEFSGTEFGTIALQSTSAAIPTVTSATGRIWMDRNLGASRVATSMTDTAAYGDLYQWGRLTDGHEKRNSSTTATLSSTDVPGHRNFITTSSEPYDWRSPGNDNLWQGVNGINNPCPTGFRLPTAEEWQEEIDSWNSKDAAGAFASPLKLITANRRFNETGEYCEFLGGYWSSTVYWGNFVNYILFYYNYGEVYLNATDRSYGYSVRCIKD